MVRNTGLAMAALALALAWAPVAHADVITGAARYTVLTRVNAPDGSGPGFQSAFFQAQPIPLLPVTYGGRSAYGAAGAAGPSGFSATGGYSTDGAGLPSAAGGAEVLSGSAQVIYDFQVGADAPYGANVELLTSLSTGWLLATRLTDAVAANLDVGALASVELLTGPSGTLLFSQSASIGLDNPVRTIGGLAPAYSFFAAPGQSFTLVVVAGANVTQNGWYSRTSEAGAVAIFEAAAAGAPVDVPEPSSAALLGAGLVAGLGLVRRRARGGVA